MRRRRAGPFLLILALTATGATIGGAGLLLLQVQRAASGVMAHRRPSAFGLPDHPAAFGFFSRDAGAAGSVAFSIRTGTAAEVAAFYEKQLRTAGWSLKRRSEVKQALDAGSTRVAPGRRLRWWKENGRPGQSLTLVVFDLPQRGTTAQAVLSWSDTGSRSD